MTTERHDLVRARLEVDFNAQPIEGTLKPDDGVAAAFTGWLGLTAAIERLGAACEAAETQSSRPPADS